jgi:geranylgeranyl diphosphate synthase, type I
MTLATLTPQRLLAEVQATLDDFLAEQSDLLGEWSEDLVAMTAWLEELMRGGKRLRPSFCAWAFVGAGGRDVEAALRAATSLELLQASALIHDDVMDGSDLRRGIPAAHRRFAALHQESGWLGDPDRFGAGAAVLLGDLCLGWADELLFRCGLDDAALMGAKPVYDRMRSEVMAGQYLDLVEQAQAEVSAQRVLRVVRYKSAKYTIERPLHLGALLAGAGADRPPALSAYGLPLGEAFQLRDDVLGVFGDPAVTGKPAGDDLREGKHTLLVAVAMRRAGPTQADRMRAGLGDPQLGASEIDDLRGIIEATGALAEVEDVITQRTDQSVAALADAGLTPEATQALAELAVAATTRRI